MRALNTAARALLARLQAGERIPMVLLLELGGDEPLYLTTAGRKLAWGGHDWWPTGLEVEPVSHAADGDLDRLTFRLPGVTTEQLGMALEDAGDVTVRLYDALVDPDSGVVADAVLSWAGTLTTPEIQDGESAVITWTAEHRAMRARRPKPSRYTNDEQQRRYPGDTSLNVDPATDAAPLAWPAASYFKQ